MTATASRPQWRTWFDSEVLFAIQPAPRDRDRVLVTLWRTDSLSLSWWDVHTGTLTPTGLDSAAFAEAQWPAADGLALYRLADHRGNEQGHLEWIDAADPGRRRDLTPVWKPYSLRGGAESVDGGIVVFNPVDEDGFALAVARTNGDPTPRVLYRSTAEAWNPLVSADGAVAFLDTTEHNPGSRRWAVTAFDTGTGARLGRLADPAGGSITGVATSPLTGDPRVLVAASRDPEGWTRPALWDPVTGALDALPSVEAALPRADLEVHPLDWSPDGRLLLLGVQWLATQWLLVHEIGGRTVRVDAPEGNQWLPLVGKPAFAADGDVLATVQNVDTPLRVVRCGVDRSPTVVLASPPAPRGRPARSVTFPSSDGTPVQAWSTVPETAGPHPTVVHVHGGPHWFAADTYNPEAQAWVAEGFGYLDVNFRGSTGRGAPFARRIWGDIGHCELEDLAAAHRWLVESGAAPADEVFLAGESYGGFLTLYALGRQPELWAGGFVMVAMADWTLAHRDASPALRAAFRSWFGGSPEELPELYRERSPITYAEAVRAPVVVAQGEHDSRTPPAQFRAYEERMRELGKDITVRWFGSGHGLGGAGDLADDVECFIATARRVLDRRRSGR